MTYGRGFSNRLLERIISRALPASSCTRKTRRNGLILFGFGGALVLTIYLLSGYLSLGLIVFPYSADLYFDLTERALFVLVISLVSFFIMGLGIYMIFKPVLLMSDHILGLRQQLKISKSGEKKIEKKKQIELQRIMSLSDEELHSELVSMKTVEQVHVPRLQVSSEQNKCQKLYSFSRVSRDGSPSPRKDRLDRG